MSNDEQDPKSPASKAYQLKSATLDASARFFWNNPASQIRAARELLGWSQKQLAQKAYVSLATVRRMEAVNSKGGFRGNVLCMVQVLAVLERNGIMFTDADPRGDILDGVQRRRVKPESFPEQVQRWRIRPYLPPSRKLNGREPVAV